uniref:SIAH-type domain-containing protein n=1 Tax=Leersia perrieri TaxID=77586 RepID=A0A0D9UW76_9ORYZ
MGEHNKRSSAAENGHTGGKKLKTNGEVKQERQEEEEEGEVSQEVVVEGESGRSLVTVAAAMEMEEPQISVRIAVGLLHCQACLLPLKPPCEVGHVVCSGCRGRHGQVCGSAAVYAHCGELDAIVATATVPCGYAAYGCDSHVVYAAAADHQRGCPHAPCACPEPGCAFTASPPSLLSHLATAHPYYPVTEISYGKPAKLAVPQPGHCHVLVGGDRDVFLVSPIAVGAATAVSVVSVRGNSGAAAGDDTATAATAQFKCKVWVEVSSSSDNMVMMTSKVRSSDLAGGLPAAGEGMFLVVPPELLQELSGETPIVSIRIDRVGAAAIAKSTTPRARGQRRSQ